MNDVEFTEFCVWDTERQRAALEGITEEEAHDWVLGWQHRRSLIADMATSPVTRYQVRCRRITAWEPLS